MPSNSKALHVAFDEALVANITPIFQFVLIKFCELANPVSAEYFRKTRLGLFGKSVDEMVPKGDNAKVEWKKLEEGFGKVAAWMRKDDPFIMKNAVSFADLVIGGWLIVCKLGYGENSQEWKEITGWHDGRWGKLVKTLEAY
ncbi:hypothetical protein D9758_013852 [Tetrapyrgos nigripes]|uniref:Glutathione S-transferase UstS-like C-terminal domain-containing protein n=1 Tax=Tetrapyrgos nigripes TaxID=182062 RepID=A0A8H5CSW6_9AGAR|nr:hypothetical protein D9758_013852 [Tetrapyrgos nigripes]